MAQVLPAEPFPVPPVSPVSPVTLPSYSLEIAYGYHLDLGFLGYVEAIEKGLTLRRVPLTRRHQRASWAAPSINQQEPLRTQEVPVRGIPASSLQLVREQVAAALGRLRELEGQLHLLQREKQQLLQRLQCSCSCGRTGDTGSGSSGTSCGAGVTSDGSSTSISPTGIGSSTSCSSTGDTGICSNTSISPTGDTGVGSSTSISPTGDTGVCSNTSISLTGNTGISCSTSISPTGDTGVGSAISLTGDTGTGSSISPGITSLASSSTSNSSDSSSSFSPGITSPTGDTGLGSSTKSSTGITRTSSRPSSGITSGTSLSSIPSSGTTSDTSISLLPVPVPVPRGYRSVGVGTEDAGGLLGDTGGYLGRVALLERRLRRALQELRELRSRLGLSWTEEEEDEGPPHRGEGSSRPGSASSDDSDYHEAEEGPPQSPPAPRTPRAPPEAAP